MKDIQDALARVGKSMAEIAQAVVKAIDNLTPEQRLVIEFLAENPEVAEAFQELNQKLARQKAIGGATKETTQPKEPLIKGEKIRMAVRAWAEADGADGKIYLTIDENGSRFTNKYGGYIGFAFQIDMEERLYTLAELCGEEEAPEPLEPSFIDLDERIREKASEKLYKRENDMHLIEEDE